MALVTSDTIVALATPAAAGGRAILRLSGPDATTVVAELGTFDVPLSPTRRLVTRGEVPLSGFHATVPVELYVWAAPKSYTGQDLVELHLLSSIPIVEALIAKLLESGARSAQAGEFTLRAFLAGKLDLTKAEAVVGVIEASSRSQLRQALTQLAGGLADPLQALRDDLLNLLADVEAGLDFTDEDIEFVGQDEQLRRLGVALAQVTNVQRQLQQRTVSETAFRIVFAGRPNAGKSSLFNLLSGGAALVSEQPGTTRDYLTHRVELPAATLELIDTAGWQTPSDTIEDQAQTLARAQADSADLVLLCLASNETLTDEERTLYERPSPPTLLVSTKCDLQTPQEAGLATSAVSGEGIDTLRNELVKRAAVQEETPMAPSVSRCQSHVVLCLEHLRLAHTLVLERDPQELLALELREALHQLGEMVGAVYTNDLLDRIFSRFCIGK